MKKIRVGCCGFRKIDEYIKEFNCVELQQTFYKFPKEETLKKYRNIANKINKNFEFYIKANQMITHPANSPTYRKINIKITKEDNYGFFKNTEEVVAATQKTLQMADALDGKFIVFQLPASFVYNKTNLKNLQFYFENIIKRTEGVKYGIELRGSSWSEEIIKKLCQELDLVDICDAFKRRSTTKCAYFRLHGAPPGKIYYKYKYTKEDLYFLMNVVKDYEEVYLLFNNIYMYEDAKEFIKILNEIEHYIEHS